MPVERLKASGLYRPNTRPLLCSPMHPHISWVRHVRESARQCSLPRSVATIREWIYRHRWRWGRVHNGSKWRSPNDEDCARKWRFIQMTINQLLNPEKNLNNLYLKTLSGILAMHVYDEDVSPLLPSKPTEIFKMRTN